MSDLNGAIFSSVVPYELNQSQAIVVDVKFAPE